MNTLLLKLAAATRSVACLLVFLAPLLHSAESAKPAVKPLLWKIDGPTPIYLFGTIHVADPSVVRYGAAVSNALHKADIVATEIEMDTEQMMKRPP